MSNQPNGPIDYTLPGCTCLMGGMGRRADCPRHGERTTEQPGVIDHDEVQPYDEPAKDPACANCGLPVYLSGGRHVHTRTRSRACILFATINDKDVPE